MGEQIGQVAHCQTIHTESMRQVVLPDSIPVMAKPVWVKIVHPVTGGKTEVQESVFAGEGGLRDRGWILEADLPKRSPKKPAKVKEQTDE